MGFAAQFRFHFMETIVYKTVQYVPLAMIGFGIHDRASFDTKTRHVNGGIIGSAFLRALNDGKEQAFLTEITGNDEKIVNFVG
jgi:tryptophan synthase alpha subunit